MLTEIARSLCIHWHFQYIYKLYCPSVPLVPQNGKVYVWPWVISLKKSESSQNRKISESSWSSRTHMPMKSRHVCFSDLQWSKFNVVYVHSSRQTSWISDTLYNCYLFSFWAHNFVAQYYSYNFFPKKVFLCCRDWFPYMKYYLFITELL